MPQFILSPTEWTQIVAAGGADAVQIVPRLGSSFISLNTATDGAALEAKATGPVNATVT